MAPCEREHGVASLTRGLKRDVLTGERVAETPPGRERSCRDEHLDPAVPPMCEQLPHQRPIVRVPRTRQLLEDLTAAGVVDRAAVVGIDEVEVPQLGALVEIRDAGRRRLDDELRQAIVDAELGDTRLKGRERLEKRRGTGAIENRPDETLDGVFVRLVRVEPVGVDFGLAKRLRHVRADAVDKCGHGRLARRVVSEIERPRPHQRLIEQIFFVRVRSEHATDIRFEPAVERSPFEHGSLPRVRDFR
jgi:hypothetical protein